MKSDCASSAIPIPHLCVFVRHFSCFKFFVTLEDWSPPCSSVHGILHARILEWVIKDWTHIFYVSALQVHSLSTEPPGKPLHIILLSSELTSHHSNRMKLCVMRYNFCCCRLGMRGGCESLYPLPAILGDSIESRGIGIWKNTASIPFASILYNFSNTRCT